MCVIIVVIFQSHKKSGFQCIYLLRHTSGYIGQRVLTKYLLNVFFENDFKVSGKCINFTLPTNLQYLGAYD